MKKILTGILAVGLTPSLLGALASCAPTSTNELAKVSNKANYNEEEYLQLRVTNRPGQTWCDLLGDGQIKSPDSYGDDGFPFRLKTQIPNVATSINLYTWSGELFQLPLIQVVYSADNQHATSSYKLSKKEIKLLWDKCPAYSEITIVPQFSEKEVKLVSLNPFVKADITEGELVIGKELHFDVSVPRNTCTIDPDNIKVWCGDRLLRRSDGSEPIYDYTFTLDTTNPEYVGHFILKSVAPDQKVVITDNIKFYVGTKTESNTHELKIAINNKIASLTPMSFAIDEQDELFEMDAPSLIDEHDRSAVSASYSISNVQGQVEASGDLDVTPDGSKISGIIKNAQTIDNSHPLVVNINISESKPQINDFEHDSWSNFTYWLEFADHDLNWFANLYNIESKDQLIGQKRHVTWDTVPHTVVVRGLQNYQISTPRDDYWSDPIPTTGEYADLTFMFDNLLTYRNGDSVRIKFKTSGIDDTGDNAWIQEYGDREDGDTQNTSYARDFVNSKKDFLNKFAADGFLDAVKGITHDRIGDGVDADGDWEDYTWSYWDKFFIPSATELGGTASFYGRETADGHDSFVRFLPVVDDDETTEDRMCSAVGSEITEPYWTASPSPRGSGFLKTEDMAYVTDNGKIDNCDMDEHKALLLMFCI